MLTYVNFLLLVFALHLSVRNSVPGINRVKFGRITRFVSSLAATMKPQPSERCQLSLLFPAIFLGCPLLRHVCIRFPATRVTKIHHCLLLDWSFFCCFYFIYWVKAWLWETAFPFQELRDQEKTSSKLTAWEHSPTLLFAIVTACC